MPRMRAEVPPPTVLSLDATLEKVVRVAAMRAPHARTHLDLGCGTGSLIAALRRRMPALESEGGDLFPDLMQLPDVRVRRVDLNDPTLPWPDASFDLVTLTEVVEHLDGCQRLFREIARILRPGGWLVMSTPNILNLASRIRYFLYGFPQMFGPFPFDAPKRETTEGHVFLAHPFHLAFFLTQAGMTDLAVTIDKPRLRSLPAFLLVFPVIRLYAGIRAGYEQKRYVSLDEGAKHALAMLNTWKLLMGRSLVVSGRKP